MNITKVSIGNWFEHIQTYLQHKEEHLCYSVQEQTEVTYGSQNDCDLEYCEEHNIPAYNLRGQAGCIVHPQGNIGIGFVYSVQKYKVFALAYIFLPKLRDYLISKGLNATIDHNDLLVDGYKVGSVDEYQYDVPNAWCYGIMQISINQDIEVIEHACKKPMVKIPKALSEYGITTEEIKNWLLETVNKLQ